MFIASNYKFFFLIKRPRIFFLRKLKIELKTETFYLINAENMARFRVAFCEISIFLFQP